MKGVDFSGSNVIYGKPDNMTDEQCNPLPAMVGADDEGLQYVVVAFKPSPEDVEAFMAGGKLFIKFAGSNLAPMSLFTIDTEGKINPM